MAKRSLKNKKVLLTGASSGIGYQMALQFARQGCEILLTARRKDRLDKLAQEIQNVGGRTQVIDGDICCGTFRANLKEFVEGTWGQVDVLVNNAGIGTMGKFIESSEDQLRQVMEVNFFAPAEMIRIFHPLLCNGIDPIVANIGSVLGHRAVPLKSEYCASKFAMHGLSDALRAELAPEIDLCLISPSTTDSEFFDSALEDQTGRDWKKKGAMSPEKVAEIAVGAIGKGTHEIILTIGGKSLVMFDRLFPTLANRAVQKWG